MVDVDGQRVFTAVLNYRHSEDTVRCLESIRASTARSQHPVVVDNGATPRTRAALASGLEATPVLETAENLGYAGGNNVAIRYALERRADFVWLLNPDTMVTPSTLEHLLTTALANPDAGILGSRVLYGSSRSPTIWFDGGVLDLRTGATAHENDGVRVSAAPSGPPRPVDYVTGAGMLVRSDVFDDVGLLPEDYFLYYEETEFNLRARTAGWEVLLDPRSVMVHHKRSTGRLPAPYYVYYYLRSRLVFAQRFCSGPLEEVEADMQRWVGAWRAKVAERDPAWAGTFEQLVTWAFEDGRAGVVGRREDIDDVPRDGSEAAG